MYIGLDKSSYIYNEMDEEVLDKISALLPYKMGPIQVGFKYLGYYLKPLSYGINDRRWILKTFERRISHSSYRLLSLGGRLVLIGAVLISSPIY